MSAPIDPIAVLIECRERVVEAEATTVMATLTHERARKRLDLSRGRAAVAVGPRTPERSRAHAAFSRARAEFREAREQVRARREALRDAKNALSRARRARCPDDGCRHLLKNHDLEGCFARYSAGASGTFRCPCARSVPS